VVSSPSKATASPSSGNVSSAAPSQESRPKRGKIALIATISQLLLIVEFAGAGLFLWLSYDEFTRIGEAPIDLPSDDLGKCEMKY
jgi:hypothetical protein